MRFRWPLLLGFCVLFAACGEFGKVRTIRPKNKLGSGMSGAQTSERSAAQLQKQREQADKDAQGPQVGMAPEEVGFLPAAVDGNMTVGGYKLHSDQNIVWSDTEDPNADIAFDKPFLQPQKRGGSWQNSYTVARREAMRTNKPIVMWFTNEGSSPSPICKTLNREVFGKRDFANWAKENVVRLKIDLSGGATAGTIGDLATRKRKYVAKLKKKYSVLGYPTVLVLQPDGTVYERYRGYKKGHGKSYLRNMKDAVLTVNHNQKYRIQKLAEKGYRTWAGKNDQEIFARLARYAEGDLTLIEPNGAKIRTNESRLSSADKKWLDAEKKKRGL